MLDIIFEKTQVLIRRILILPGRAAGGREQHVEMLEAMRRGDAEEAERVRRSVATIEASPLLPGSFAATGFVYDVRSGTLEAV